MKRGFTLIELSIVLIIIGLLVGGVLVGKDLIRQAQLSAVTREYQNYKTALNTFILKYDAIPGDMDNAEDYWGTDPNGCPAGGGGSGTCNGTGNGVVPGGDSSALYSEENWRFFQHMGLAGVINGDYFGIGQDGADSGDCVRGLNVPPAIFADVGFITYPRDGGANPNTLDLQLGSGSGVPHGNCSDSAALTPAEALAVDSKADDGLASTGRIIGRAGAGVSDCYSSSDNDQYNLADESVLCRMWLELLEY